MAATCRGLGVTLRRSKSDLFRFALTLLVLFAVSGALEAQSKPRVVTTLAGTASEGYAGDGGPALSAKFMAVSGIAIDAKGNVYVADTQNYRIRKIDPASGIITTIAGSGQVWPMGGGFSGDGGPATAALLQLPQGVGVDSAGNLYIADSNNNRVRKVDMHGKITTVAGNGYHAPGMNFPFGDGGFSGDGGPAVSARLNHPTRVCVDSQGNLFIADMANHRIRKVDRDGIITTVAGSGQTGYAGDGGLASRAQLFAPNDV